MKKRYAHPFVEAEKLITVQILADSLHTTRTTATDGEQLSKPSTFSWEEDEDDNIQY